MPVDFQTLSTEDPIVLHGITLSKSAKTVLLACLRLGDVVNDDLVSKDLLIELMDVCKDRDIVSTNMSFTSDFPALSSLDGMDGGQILDALLAPKPCTIPFEERLKAYVSVVRLKDKPVPQITLPREPLEALLQAVRETIAVSRVSVEDIGVERDPKLKALQQAVWNLDIPLLMVSQHVDKTPGTQIG